MSCFNDFLKNVIPWVHLLSQLLELDSVFNVDFRRNLMPLLSTIPPFCANFALQSRQAQRRQLNLRRNEYNIITIEPKRSK